MTTKEQVAALMQEIMAKCIYADYTDWDTAAKMIEEFVEANKPVVPVTRPVGRPPTKPQE